MKLKIIVLSIALACSLSACAEAPPRRHAAPLVEVDVRPPPPRIVVVPAARVGYVWAPGYWRWNGRAHVWVDGRFMRERRGWHWQPAHWEEHGNRWHFEEGHWQR